MREFTYITAFLFFLAFGAWKATAQSSPISLLTPADGALLTTTVPTFTWQMPAPPSGEPVTYDIEVVEVMTSQTPLTAMAINPRIWARLDMTATSVVYASSTPLMPGKTYAWRITANADQNFYAWSLTWTFTIPGGGISPPMPTEPIYAELQSKMDAGYYVVKNNFVHFKFDRIYDQDIKEIEVRTFDGEILTGWNQTQDGDNLFSLYIPPYPNLSGYYSMKVKNVKDRILWLKFYIP